MLFFLHAMTHFSRMLAPPLASLTMDAHLWVPFAIGLILMMLQIVLVYFLQESRPSERVLS